MVSKTDLLKMTDDSRAYFRCYEKLDSGKTDVMNYVEKKLNEGYAFIISDVDEEQGEIKSLEYFQLGDVKKKNGETEKVGYYYQFVPSYEYNLLDGNSNVVDVASDESNITDPEMLTDEIVFAYENLGEDDFIDPEYRREMYVSKVAVDPEDENYFGPVEKLFVDGWMRENGSFYE